MKDEHPIGEENVVYSSRIFEVTTQLYQVEGKEILFEFAKRAPGVRLLITDGERILLTKEYRSEIEDTDYRLPGGKMFKSFADYKLLKDDQERLMEAARAAVKEECEEETGLTPLSIERIHVTDPGATVTWDLHYFLIETFESHPDGQQLKEAEVIEPEWKTCVEVKEMCLDGSIREDRTVAVLLRYLLSKGL